jgi:hypothetical protein
MRNGKNTIAIILLLLAIGAGAAFSLDLGMQGWIGNLAFKTDRAVTDVTLPGADYFWGLSLYGTQSISDSINFETGFYSDPVLRNISYTLFNYSQKVLSVGIGPFFGLFNDTTTLLKSGISTSVKLELPGIVFVSFRSDSSIGGQLIQVGDYLQSRSDIEFGFYVPNAICTLSLNSRTFDQKAAADDVVDSMTTYAFTTNLYRKNVPYQLIVKVAYQSIARSFIVAAKTASLNSVILGTELDVSLSNSLVLQAGIEGNVYSFGLGTLVGSDPAFLFHTFAGVKMSVDAIPFLSTF